MGPIRNAGNEARQMNEATVLVVDRNLQSVAGTAEMLGKEGLKSERATSATDGLRRLHEKGFDVVIVNRNLPEMTGAEFSKVAKVVQPETEVVLLNGEESVNPGARAVVPETVHFLSGPVDPKRLASWVHEKLKEKGMVIGESCGHDVAQKDHAFEAIVGRCERMREVFRLIEKVAATAAPVIIQGESGTGKELVARAIHNRSRRKKQKFLAINSASLPETLLESELFGYRRGAFTGAQRDKVGLLESANGGTLLLDEIASMSKHLQGKLLRAMQDGEILPVGSSERVRIDVRILAASNRNLTEMVGAGEFRKDLYYRLNVIEIVLPPLRDRKEDIPLLVEHFLQKYSHEEGMQRKTVGEPAMKKFLTYSWPGNVRELENVVRRALIISKDPVIKVPHIQLRGPGRPNISGRSDVLSMKYREAKGIVQGEFQRAYVKRLLSECGGNVSKAASRAGLSRQALHQMAKRYGLK